MPLDEYLAWYHTVRKESYSYRYVRIAIILFILLVLIRVATATTIIGTTYDLTLEPLNNVIVEIDTQPPQKMITKDGIYSFEIPQGSYLIKAKYYEENYLKYEDQQSIEITNEGQFVFDLILFPSLEEDEKLYDTSDLDMENPYDDGKVNIVLISGIILGILTISGLWWWYFKFRTFKNKKDINESKEQVEEKSNDEYYDLILNMIKEHKRVTQKEIRKEIPLSEAKISLIISELEHEGIIEKIKKGRGNILVLK